MQEQERRQALADFLRRRRARLSPTDVGLPPGFRRRTPGLRREEVAQLANMGTSWYVWLEQSWKAWLRRSDCHPMSVGTCFCSPGNHFLPLLFHSWRRASVRRSNKCSLTSTRVQRMFWDDGMTIWHGTKLPMLFSPFQKSFLIHRLPMLETLCGDSSPTRLRENAPIGRRLRRLR